jgi:hypothetical protein
MHASELDLVEVRRATGPSSRETSALLAEPSDFEAKLALDRRSERAHLEGAAPRDHAPLAEASELKRDERRIDGRVHERGVREGRLELPGLGGDRLGGVHVRRILVDPW